MKFKVILADPAWPYEVWSRDTGQGRSAEAHYPTMSLEDIAALPVGDLADSGCVLFLWVTWPVLYQAQTVIEAWGFEYKTLAFDWVKATKAGQVHIGMGYWTRANSEPCLLCTRGKPRRKDAGVSQVIWENLEPETIIAPVGRHSQKPEEQYSRIESLVAGSYLELFARRTRAGWVSLGNEIDGCDLRESIPALARVGAWVSTPTCLALEALV